MNDMEIKNIGIDEIKQFTFERTVFNKEEILSLAESIAKDGQLQPVRVSPLPDGGFLLVYGWERFNAVKMAKLPTIRAEVLEKPITEIKAMIDNTIENHQRQNLNLYDQARQIKKLVDIGVKKGDIAKLLRKANSFVSDTLKVLDMPPKIIDSIKKGEIGIAQVRELNNIPDSKKLEILPEIKNNTVKETVKKITEEHKLTKLEQDLQQTKKDIKYYTDKLNESENAEVERNSIIEQLKEKKKEQKILIKKIKTLDNKGEFNKLLTGIAKLDRDYYPTINKIEVIKKEVEQLNEKLNEFTYDEKEFKKLDTERLNLIKKKTELTAELSNVNNDIRIVKSKYDKLKEKVDEQEKINKEKDQKKKSIERLNEDIKKIESEHKIVINNIDDKREQAKKFESELTRNIKLSEEIVELTKQEGSLRGTANNKKAHEKKIESLKIKEKGLTSEIKKSKK